MLTLATDKNNSIYLDENGNLKTIEGKEALAQTLGQISKARLGEMQYTMTNGIPYMDAVFQYRDLLRFEITMRNQFMKHPEVTNVVSFQMFEKDNILSFEAVVDSIYGEVSVSG